MSVNPYISKLKLLENDAIYASLGKDSKSAIAHIGEKYNFSFQELRQLTEISVDFKMWNEKPISSCLEIIENDYQEKPNKKVILAEIKKVWNSLKNSKANYEDIPSKSHYRPDLRKIKYTESDNKVLGMCPVASDKTVCCNLMTVDAIQGCGLGCSYCSIQTFYTDGKISIDKNLSEKLNNITLDPNKNYHIGSGQSSDSLAMGNTGGVIDAQLDFARKNPNIIFEFKTKSKNIKYLLNTDVPKNVFVSWSLNPQIFIDNEEHGTASISQRLASARALSDNGILVGFHFHPIVFYNNYQKDYSDIIQNLRHMFSSDEIAMISMGTLTFIKSAIKKLRKAGLNTKVLQIPMSDAVGKSSYSLEIKKEIFNHVYNEFSFWHEKVFFYLCMEESIVWEMVFGSYYKNNEQFESALFNSVYSKMNVTHIV